MLCHRVVALFAILGVAVPGLHAADQVPDERLQEVVDRRLEDWWLRPEERQFDEIGWADDIRHAQQLAGEFQRPVFLFTMDGRVNTGRC